MSIVNPLVVEFEVQENSEIVIPFELTHEYRPIIQNDAKVEQNAANTISYSYWRPLLVGASSNVNPGVSPVTTTDKTYAFETLQVQPSTGTYRGNAFKFVNGSYEASLSATTLTTNRDFTLPDKGGMLASTSDIPAAATANPVMDGTAAVGSSSKYAKEDHVHPSDTSRAAVSSVPASASIDANGLITFKNSSDASVFTLQLPVYSGSVTPSANGVSF